MLFGDHGATSAVTCIRGLPCGPASDDSHAGALLREVASPAIVTKCGGRYSAMIVEDRSPTGRAVEVDVRLPASLRKASRKRQVEYAAGRFGARHALMRLGTPHCHDVAIGADRAPSWPAGVVGSITHTTCFVSVAVASSRDVRSVGIDSELVVSPRRRADIEALVLCGRERALLRSSARLSQEVLATLLFSAKESVFKCLYPIVRVFFDFQAAEVFAVEPSGGSFRYRLLCALNAEFGQGYYGRGSFALAEGHVHTGVELE